MLRLVRGRLAAPLPPDSLVVWEPTLVLSGLPLSSPSCSPETLRQLPTDFPFRQFQSDKPNAVPNYTFNRDPNPNSRPSLLTQPTWVLCTPLSPSFTEATPSP